MRLIFFCQNAYAFGIMRPLRDVAKQKRYSYTWFITKKLENLFPFPEDTVTQDIATLQEFDADAIICPGNEVPHYLKGIKTQIFHGLAGEKKGHFRIRHYFDLYLTQGPYFTKGFNALKEKYNNFEVTETGWSKLDTYAELKPSCAQERTEILKKHSAKNILLYAPTFSPSLTSAGVCREAIQKLANNPDYVIHIKFHDLMHQDHIDFYKQLAGNTTNVQFIEDKDIVKQLLIADVLISDTSSVIYEFLLLDKPAITINNISKNIRWQDIETSDKLIDTVRDTIMTDPYQSQRAGVITDYHPYHDGKSSERMLNAILAYKETYGIPEKRKLSWLRRRKINKIFGKLS